MLYYNCQERKKLVTSEEKQKKLKKLLDKLPKVCYNKDTKKKGNKKNECN